MIREKTIELSTSVKKTQRRLSSRVSGLPGIGDCALVGVLFGSRCMSERVEPAVDAAPYPPICQWKETSLASGWPRCVVQFICKCERPGKHWTHALGVEEQLASLEGGTLTCSQAGRIVRIRCMPY